MVFLYSEGRSFGDFLINVSVHVKNKSKGRVNDLQKVFRLDIQTCRTKIVSFPSFYHFQKNKEGSKALTELSTFLLFGQVSHGQESARSAWGLLPILLHRTISEQRFLHCLVMSCSSEGLFTHFQSCLGQEFKYISNKSGKQT